MIARDCLAASLVDPALSYLQERGAELRLNCRVRALEITDDRIAAFHTNGESVALAPEDRVIMALPPAGTAQLLMGLAVPKESSAIVNAHYLLPEPPKNLKGLSKELPFLGLTGGTADWLFLRGSVASITVSAADELATKSSGDLALGLWRDTAKALGFDQETPLPPHRIIKEKRATFAQTPESLRLRAKPETSLSNLFLAGDWTDTGFPATIESAVRSGQIAVARSLVTTL